MTAAQEEEAAPSNVIPDAQRRQVSDDQGERCYRWNTSSGYYASEGRDPLSTAAMRAAKVDRDEQFSDTRFEAAKKAVDAKKAAAAKEKPAATVKTEMKADSQRQLKALAKHLSTHGLDAKVQRACKDFLTENSSVGYEALRGFCEALMSDRADGDVDVNFETVWVKLPEGEAPPRGLVCPSLRDPCWPNRLVRVEPITVADVDLDEYKDSEGNPMIAVGQLKAVARVDIAKTDRIPLPVQAVKDEDKDSVPGYAIEVKNMFNKYNAVDPSRKAGGSYINDVFGSNRSRAWKKKRKELINVHMKCDGNKVFFKPIRNIKAGETLWTDYGPGFFEDNDGSEALCHALKTLLPQPTRPVILDDSEGEEDGVFPRQFSTTHGYCQYPSGLMVGTPSGLKAKIMTAIDGGHGQPWAGNDSQIKQYHYLAIGLSDDQEAAIKTRYRGADKATNLDSASRMPIELAAVTELAESPEYLAKLAEVHGEGAEFVLGVVQVTVRPPGSLLNAHVDAARYGDVIVSFTCDPIIVEIKSVGKVDHIEGSLAQETVPGGSFYMLSGAARTYSSHKIVYEPPRGVREHRVGVTLRYFPKGLLHRLSSSKDVIPQEGSRVFSMWPADGNIDKASDRYPSTYPAEVKAVDVDQGLLTLAFDRSHHGGPWEHGVRPHMIVDPTVSAPGSPLATELNEEGEMNVPEVGEADEEEEEKEEGDDLLERSRGASGFKGVYSSHKWESQEAFPTKVANPWRVVISSNFRGCFKTALQAARARRGMLQNEPRKLVSRGKRKTAIDEEDSSSEANGEAQAPQKKPKQTGKAVEPDGGSADAPSSEDVMAWGLYDPPIDSPEPLNPKQVAEIAVVIVNIQQPGKNPGKFASKHTIDDWMWRHAQVRKRFPSHLWSELRDAWRESDEKAVNQALTQLTEVDKRRLQAPEEAPRSRRSLSPEGDESESELVAGWFPFRSTTEGADRWRWVTGKLTKQGGKNHFSWHDGDEWKDLRDDAIDRPPMGRRFGRVVYGEHFPIYEAAWTIMPLTPSQYKAMRYNEDRASPGQREGTARTRGIAEKAASADRYIKAGDQVMAQYPLDNVWQGSRIPGKWFRATVRSIDSDTVDSEGTVTVAWDDKDPDNTKIKIEAVRVGWDRTDGLGRHITGPPASFKPTQAPVDAKEEGAAASSSDSVRPQKRKARDKTPKEVPKKKQVQDTEPARREEDGCSEDNLTIRQWLRARRDTLQHEPAKAVSSGKRKKASPSYQEWCDDDASSEDEDQNGSAQDDEQAVDANHNFPIDQALRLAMMEQRQEEDGTASSLNTESPEKSKAMKVKERLLHLEETLGIEENAGAIDPRLSAVEITIYGYTKAGSIMDRLAAVEKGFLAT